MKALEEKILKDRMDGIDYFSENLVLDNYFKNWFHLKIGVRPSTKTVYEDIYKM